MLTEARRAYLYRVGTAVIPLLVLLGLVANHLAQQILLILAAVLAVGEGGLAAANTSTTKTTRPTWPNVTSEES